MNIKVPGKENGANGICRREDIHKSKLERIRPRTRTYIATGADRPVRGARLQRQADRRRPGSFYSHGAHPSGSLIQPVGASGPGRTDPPCVRDLSCWLSKDELSSVAMISELTNCSIPF